MTSTPYYPGRMPSEKSFISRWGPGLLFSGVLAVAPSPVRRWMLTMMALFFGIIFTIKDTPELNAWDPGVTRAEWEAWRAAPDGFLGTGYLFPWYCIAFIVAFVFWGTFGYIRAWRLCRAYREAGMMPLQRLRRAVSNRVLIAVDGTQRPPQSPTGPSQRTTAPPPTSATYERQSSTVGSNLPAVWVPTYSGPAKPVRRIETTLGGTVIHDHRGVDPEEL